MSEGLSERKQARGVAEPVGASSPARSFWSAVDRLVEPRLADVDGLSIHGLGPLAADLLQRLGRPIPLPFVQQLRAAGVANLTAPALVARVRNACADGPMLLVKGPEAAVRYPRGARAFYDIDLLVPDAAKVQRALLAAGFVEEEDPEGLWIGIHHLAPVSWPGLPLRVEVHAQPKWPEGLTPPPIEELFDRAVPTALGVQGVLSPSPACHTLLIAAHAWAHQPLGRARDLLDVGALGVDADPTQLARLAESWGLAPVWRTTSAALDALLTARRTLPLRLWAAHTSELRVQTVLEDHFERVFSPFWGLPPGDATRRAASALRGELRPAFDEGWHEKMTRSAAALRRALVPVTRHRHLLGDSATRGRRRNKPPSQDP